MLSLYLIQFLLLCSTPTLQSENLRVIARSQTASLETYESYLDAVVNNFRVPENTVFASFRFTASEQDLSVFGCSTRNVSLYMKYGSPPVINPDGSPFPDDFKNITRPEIYNLEFFTNRKEHYINISAPDPGIYYVASFLSYSDPRYRALTQQGLGQSCYASVETVLHVKQAPNPTIIAENQYVDVTLNQTGTRHFKFYIPEGIDHASIYIDNFIVSKYVKSVNIWIQAKKPPTPDSYLIEKAIFSNDSAYNLKLRTEPESWHYMTIATPGGIPADLEFNFMIKYFSSQIYLHSRLLENDDIILNTTTVIRTYYSSNLTETQPYKLHYLVRESSSESFLFSFELEDEFNSKVLVPINVSSDHFSVLKFKLLEGHDIGGTLQYILAFRPTITKAGKFLRYSNDPGEDIVVACINHGSIAVPTWPNLCVSSSETSQSQLLLNSSTSNSTILIPYPEYGVWYASFKLFSGECDPCNCSDSCQSDYSLCTDQCELISINSNEGEYENCMRNCSSTVIAMDECSSCNCDGPCKKNSDIHNASVVFDVSSRPCYYGDCGRNGRCVFMISEGTVYSTCYCTNSYRGFDCSDGSLATPYYLVVIGFLLLVFSNLLFLPSTYVAFKRKYYVEALSYFSVFIFSSLYHACDAGENILSVCVTRLSTLQFADFFSALYSMWLTLLAIADLNPTWLSVLQVAGSIVIAFFVTLNKLAVWIFLIPTCLGIIIIGVNWFQKYWKFKQRFIDKIYLRIKMPLGILSVLFGLIIFGLLQTENNYKYLHSLWHIMMAVATMLLLPKRNTFQVEVLL
ncbi:post-GPI attachment to proteins factor 6 [Cylas formicarius]|uniref:post-GPI attachment to proteins factor 6 n=1 Tax=Cylas formicarius TaxID=197179 RepID=UPI002958A391|nr:post-GPI attachment to proteins factor 6 [Cylas formicarius]